MFTSGPSQIRLLVIKSYGKCLGGILHEKNWLPCRCGSWSSLVRLQFAEVIFHPMH